MLYILAFIAIIILIFVNGFTDAPNAITTVVSTQVLPFKKAAKLSAISNLIGIIVMCLISFRVANGISQIVILAKGKPGIIALLSSIIACIIFSVIASFFGIPTSETHGLIAGLIGSSIVVGSFHDVNIKECLNIILGLIWSILGSVFIVKVINKLFEKTFYNIKLNIIKKYQIYTALGLSFMHGAQDGQKFIGLVILFLSIINGNYLVNGTVQDYVWIIILVAIIMFFGVSVGGRKIVENIGNNATQLDNAKGIMSDLGTIMCLFLASLWGFPVSTTHVKTVSIITLAESNSNKKSISSIFNAWFLTFPLCFFMSYLFAKILVNIA